MERERERESTAKNTKHQELSNAKNRLHPQISFVYVRCYKNNRRPRGPCPYTSLSKMESSDGGRRPLSIHPLNQNGIIEWGRECRFHICRGRRSACRCTTAGCRSTRGHSARSWNRPPQDTPLEHTQHTGHFAVGNTAFLSRN